MVSGRISYPSGAEVRAWAGAVTPTSFGINADFTQTVDAVALQVSPNADMSNPVFTSSYVFPTISQGVLLTYETVALSATGLSPNTKYYWRLLYQAAPGSGGRIRSLTTAPATATAFSFAQGSCCDLFAPATRQNFSAPVFQSIAADAPLFFLHTGDIIYSDVSVASAAVQRDTNARQYRNCADVDIMHRSVPSLYITSDHDMAQNDCSLDSYVYGGPSTPSAATIFADSRQVYSETVPAYPMPLAGLLTQVATFGSVRLLLLDAYSQSTYVGNTCLGSAQLAWLQAQLNQAATDGITWLFIAQGRTWTCGSSGFHGFSDSFPAEQKQIGDMIEACMVPVCLLTGDCHAGGFDDGTNTAVSTDGFAFFPQLVSSGLYQFPSSASGPYTWNGSAAYYHFGSDFSNRHSQYMLAAMSADNKSWVATIKGDTIDPVTFAPTTIASVSSTDVTRAVSFDSASMSGTHGQALTVNLDVTWFGSASVDVTFNGQTVTVPLKPNSKRTSFQITPPSAGSFSITLSNPQGCTIGGTNPATVTVT